MLNTDALRAELAKDEHKNRSPEEIAVALNAKTTVVDRPIPAEEVLKLWSRWMVLAIAEEIREDLRARRSDENFQARVLLTATIQNLSNRVFADLDPSDESQTADIAKYLEGLVQVGVLTAEQRDETLALGKVEVPFPVSVGTNNLNADEIAEALKNA